MAALILALALAAQAAPTPDTNEVDELLVQLQRHGWVNGTVPTEQAVIRSLNELAVDEPDRVVCVQRMPAGSRHKRNYCTSFGAGTTSTRTGMCLAASR